jgi:hypothetical protein
VVVRKRLHRLLNELVTLVFKALAVTELARVDTATEVIVLRRRGGRPVAICWHHIVDLQLLRNFLDAQVQSIGIKLLGRHG